MSIQKSLKKVFRTQKDKQDELAKEIAEETKKLCVVASDTFKSNKCKFPKEEKEVENFVKYTMKKYCQRAIDALQKESDDILGKLKDNHFQDLEWKYKNFLLKGIVGVDTKIAVDDDNVSKRSLPLKDDDSKNNVEIINLVQQPLRVAMLFTTLKKTLEKNSNDKTKRSNAIEEFKGALDKEFTDKINSDVMNLNPDVMKLLDSTIAKATEIVGKINSRGIKKVYDSIVLKQKKLKNMVKEEGEKYSPNEIKKSIAAYKENLNGIREYIKEGSDFCKENEGIEETLKAVRKYLDGEVQKFPNKVDPKEISNVKNFVKVADAIYDNLVIAPECDEDIRKRYAGMYNNLSDIDDRLKRIIEGKNIES